MDITDKLNSIDNVDDLHIYYQQVLNYIDFLYVKALFRIAMEGFSK